MYIYIVFVRMCYFFKLKAFWKYIRIVYLGILCNSENVALVSQRTQLGKHGTLAVFSSKCSCCISLPVEVSEICWNSETDNSGRSLGL